EVTHEALLDAWPRLVGWRREDAEGARLRDQLRAAARQWTERNRPSGLLWRGDALAEFRLWRSRYPGSLTAAEEAFAAASLAEAARGRRLRRVAFGAAFLALATFAVVLLVQNARVERGARQMHALLRDQYEDQGRRLLLTDDPVLALAYLHKASRLGARGPAHDFLLAHAVRATDGEVFALHHDGLVGRVRFSPDGAPLASAAMAGTARLWDSRTGALIARLEHDAPGVRAEWSPRGDRIATGAEDGVVRLWGPRGAPERRMPQGAAIQALAFTPDGAQLVSATVEDEIALWNAATGERVAVLQAASPGGLPSTARTAIAVSPDGALLAAGDRTGSIRLWRLPDPQPIAWWQAHRQNVYRVHFSPDGALLVSSAAGEDEAVVWRVVTREPVLRLEHKDSVRAAVFSPDGQRILTASDDRTAAVWSAASGKRLHTLSGHAGAVWEAIWSRDGRIIASASDDGTANLWDAETGRRVARRVGHRGGLRDVAFATDGKRMATASLDQRAIVWTTDASLRVTPLAGHRADVLTADFSPSGAHILTGSQDGTARIWDAATGQQLLVLEHGEGVTARFSPDGRRVATGCDDAKVRIWDARSGDRLMQISAGRDPVTEVAWDSTGELVAATSVDGAVRVWSAETGELRRVIKNRRGARLHWVAFLPSRRVLVTNADGAGSQLWDADSGRELASFPDPDQRQLGSVDPAGRRVVSATPRRTAQVWRLADGAVERELTGHVGNVVNARWSASGDFIVTV
ncbi:MAG TPA: WD40 repeat domain-containing protein, partial [Kofleriaceae bacterium]|nr:WD40 repeat domain-containing protein [Kofleriaceae bacterium]